MSIVDSLLGDHKQFQEELLKLIPMRGQLIVCGDFNIYPNDKDSFYKSLLEAMASKGLDQLIDKATHNKGNILDHLYTRDVTNPAWMFHYPYYSDHEAICLMAEL